MLEGGAGTGLATRALVALGAHVVGFDLSAPMLEHASRNAAGAYTVLADGNHLPFADGCADLCCFAQSWHWLDPLDAVPEVARVLRADGAWAAWWSHPRADGTAWFDQYQRLLEHSTSYDRRQRDIDWSRDVAASRRFGPPRRIDVAWRREVALDVWMRDERSKSYIGLLEPHARDALLTSLEAHLRLAFPGGTLTVPYETWLWIAKCRTNKIGPLRT